jgi:zinc D-Ala-D-Ala dipeptidase
MIHTNFIDIKKLDNSIIVDLKYYSDDNFIGRKIDGYESNTALLMKNVAIKLCHVQQQLKKSNQSLIIFDAYRPQKASEMFYHWSLDPSDQKNKLKYYPKIDKKELYNLGFIARRSSHSRGIAVDINILDYKSDSLMDMGGGFDLFDEISNTDYNLITHKQIENRMYLKNIMENFGFENLPTEWWHYSLSSTDSEVVYYDFDIC